MIHLISNKKQLFTTSAFTYSTPDLVEEYLQKHKLVGADTETTSFEPQRGELLTIQLGDANDQFIIDTTTINPLFLKPYFENPQYTWIFHNGKFDWRWLKKHDIEVVNIWDTFLAECVLTAGYVNRNLGLDAVAWKYCEAKLDKSVRGEITYQGLTNRTIKYCADDVTYLHKIREKQLIELSIHELMETMLLENKVTNIFAECEYNGINLDAEAWLNAANVSEEALKRIEQSLDNRVSQLPELLCFHNKYVQTSMFGYTQRPVNINYASPKQVAKLVNLLGYTCNSTNATELEKINHPLIQEFIKYKKQQKLVTTYGKSVLKNIRPDGTITTQFFQIVDTGRVSSGDKDNGYINLQNIPASQVYRTPFIAAPDEVLICADFTAMEAVVAAEVSGEHDWIKANNENLDLHSLNAAMAFGAKWTKATEPDCVFVKNMQKCKCSEHKIMRDKIKTTTYLYLFGGGAEKLSKQLNITKSEAKSILTAFSKAVPSLQATVTKVRNYAQKFLFMRTLPPFRRKRFFENPEHMEPEARDMYKSSIDRQSFNFYIQGSSADICKLAMCLIKEELVRQQLYHKFRLQVHDEIIISTYPNLAEQVKIIIEDKMREAGTIVLKQAKLGCTAEISKFWKK